MLDAKKFRSAAGIAALAATSAPALSQDNPASEIRVGIIDIQADRLTFSDRNTEITYREYISEGKWAAQWMTESGHDHGQMVASAFVRQTRSLSPDSPIKIYAANVFQEGPGTNGARISSNGSNREIRRKVSVNWEGAREALSWFAENDVKVVLTAFNGNDTQTMRDFVQESERLGMIVFASAGNQPGGPTYPAQYPQTISVAADNTGLAYDGDATQAQWVDFTMNGSVPEKMGGRNIDRGSSYASAKAAAFGAYYVAHNPDADRINVIDALQSVSTETQYDIQGQTVTSLRLDENESSEKLTRISYAISDGVIHSGQESNNYMASQNLISSIRHHTNNAGL